MVDWKKLTPEEQERVKEEGRRNREEEKKRKQDKREPKEEVHSPSHLLCDYSNKKVEEKRKGESSLKDGRGITVYNELFRCNSFSL